MAAGCLCVQGAYAIRRYITALVRKAGLLLISLLLVFSYAVADYQIPIPDTYYCLRIDGRVGNTGNWLSQQETAEEWGRMVIAYPEGEPHANS